jgi:cyclohexa-1,5-dienecarbonyl-CoA hydratase
VSAEPLAIEDRDGARWITLQRPPLNVLDLPTIRALHLAIRPRSRRRDLKVIVLRSGIPGTFSAGVDVRDHGKDRVSDMLEAFHALFRLIDGMPQATVASVDGRCLGGGCELAAFCDILLATPGSVFAQPEIDIGCFPPVASVLLPRIAGRAGLEMVLTGRPLTAPEAARAGLVTRVVDDLAGETEACVARLTDKSGAVLALARKAVRQGGRGSFDKALERMERIYRKELLETHDVEEGVAAFLEKRPPRWTGR